MQYSRAQDAADGFVSFKIDPVTYGGIDAGTELGNLKYVSDWLQLWLELGVAYEECGVDFATYAHAVALVFAEHSIHPTLFDNLPLLPPQPTDEEDIGFVTSASYALPASITLDGFMALSIRTNKQRSRSTKRFVEDPDTWRYGYNSFGKPRGG